MIYNTITVENMALTEEQRRRMEENRKRALEIKRKKQLEREEKEKRSVEGNNVFEAGGFVSSSTETVESQSKKRRLNGALPNDGNAGGKGGNVEESTTSKKSNSSNGDSLTTKDTRHDNDDESSLEEFELSASQYVSQTEAQRTYCIPKGTLEVCSFIEKDNPHKRGWSKMKLYDRSEVRRRARKRFGGKEGLIQEREKRKKKRFEKDMEDMKDVFR